MNAMTSTIRPTVRRWLPLAIWGGLSCGNPVEVELLTVMLYGHVSDAAGAPHA
ncbi:MAG: hypothetical protein O7I93_01620 [Gemmatimonadetes bacterium]|nr:hypothetical protein [Gemmatimonadota bacterium]